MPRPTPVTAGVEVHPLRGVVAPHNVVGWQFAEGVRLRPAAGAARLGRSVGQFESDRHDVRLRSWRDSRPLLNTPAAAGVFTRTRS